LIFDGLEDVNGRDVAPLLARGVARLFEAMAHASLAEFSLRNGRRADLLALDGDGRFTIVEIKSSLADFRADSKWPDYLEFCDRFYFAVPQGFPVDVLPETEGLMIADRWDAAIVRPSVERAMHGSRRKALTLRFARQAALRLQRLADPAPGAG
jgi:hypothetical protein